MAKIGILIIQPKKYVLMDLSGKKILEKTDFKTMSELKEGDYIYVSSREMEVSDCDPVYQYLCRSGNIWC